MPATSTIPPSAKPVFWSYDVEKLNPEADKRLIISQILNYGTAEATFWLFRTYGKEDIRKEASLIPRGQWDKKSLALWSLYLGINPQTRQNKILHGR